MTETEPYRSQAARYLDLKNELLARGGQFVDGRAVAPTGPDRPEPREYGTEAPEFPTQSHAVEHYIDTRAALEEKGVTVIPLSLEITTGDGLYGWRAKGIDKAGV